MHALNKNSFLQLETSGVHPKVLNRSVIKARNKQCDNIFFECYFDRLTSHQPCIPIIKNIDITRRPVAFGRWALPKLRRELHHYDEMVVMQSILSIKDIVRDPEKGYEAIRLRIPDRMQDLMLKENMMIRENILLAYIVLAGLADGRTAIVRNKKILVNFVRLLDDEKACIRLKNAVCLEMIALTWMTAEELVNFGFIPLLLQKLQDVVNEIVIYHLQTIKNLMYGCDAIQIAIDNDAYPILVNLLNHENTQIISKSLDCLMLITSTDEGKELAIRSKLIFTLNKLLHYEESEVHISAASVIVYCTTDSRAKVIASRIKKLPKRLLKLAKNPLNQSLQLFCIKALTSLCEHPVARKAVLEKYYDDLMAIKVGNDKDMKQFKETLMGVVNWLPWETALHNQDLDIPELPSVTTKSILKLK